MATEPLNKKLEHYLDQLKQIGGEIQLDVHLAGMDAKVKWEELQKNMRDVERTAVRASDVSLQAAEDLIKKLRAFQASYKTKHPNARP